MLRTRATPSAQRTPHRDSEPVRTRNAVQVLPEEGGAIDLESLANRLQGAAAGIERTAHLLRFEADSCRFTVFPGGRALLFGVDDPLRARALYDRWLR